MHNAKAYLVGRLALLTDLVDGGLDVHQQERAAVKELVDELEGEERFILEGGVERYLTARRSALETMLETSSVSMVAQGVRDELQRLEVVERYIAKLLLKVEKRSKADQELEAAGRHLWTSSGPALRLVEEAQQVTLAAEEGGHDVSGTLVELGIVQTGLKDARERWAEALKSKAP